jgi:hypothetical protein
VASRKVHRVPNRPIVHDDTPPAPPATKLDDRDLVRRSSRETGGDLVVLRCLMR